jgi:PHD/YefM family antitoxin component YafN of YafNO toxin-antitoxin module
MLTFTKDEIIPSTKVSRNLGSFLNKLKKNQLEKIVIMRNNEMEAIIIPYEDYEIMKDIIESNEYKEIYKTIKERNKTNESEYKDLDEILKNMRINKNDL